MLFRATGLKRVLFFVISDAILSIFSIYFAFLLRFDFDIPSQYHIDIFKAWLLLSGIRLLIFSYFSL